MIANRLKINPTNAKNAAKNPKIIGTDMQFEIKVQIYFRAIYIDHVGIKFNAKPYYLQL